MHSTHRHNPFYPVANATATKGALVALVLGFGWNVAVSAQGPAFPSPVFPFGSNFISAGLAVADLSGDSKQDIVAVWGSVVSVFIGSGSGHFSPPVNYPANSSPVAVAVGQLDGDGIPDVVVTNLNSNVISVLKGTGGGALGAPATYATAVGPTAVVLSDVNGDSNLDALVACRNSNVVSVLLGNGIGGFGAATNFSVATFPVSVVVADFNNDGKKDFATCNTQSTSNVSVRLGDGIGGFGAVTNFLIGTSKAPSQIATGDFNQDGNVDVVAGHAGLSAQGATVFLGTGFGGFAAGFDISFGSGPGVKSVVVADFNADGRADIAAANSQISQLAIRFGNGLGAFPTLASVPAPNKPVFLALGDVNGDGRPDVSTVSSLPEVQVFVGDGAGSFVTGKVFMNGVATYGTVHCDFNKDGNPDVLAPLYQANTVYALAGNGAGNLAAPTLNTSGAVPRSIAIGDFNLDSTIDYAVANQNSNNVVVALGTGGASFGTGVSYAVGMFPRTAHVADFNLDAKPDVLTVNMNSNDVSMLAGDGLGGFAATQNSAIGNTPMCGATADFNADGITDVFVGRSSVQTAHVFVGNGTGGFPTFASSSISTSNETQQCVAPGDVNLDGIPDLVVGVGNATLPTLGVRILHGLGGGTFTVHSTISKISTDGSVNSLALGDVDGDGRPDLFVANSHRVGFHRQDGLGNFVSAGAFSGGLFPELGSLGDLDLDGRPDVTFGSSSGGGGITWLRNLASSPAGVSTYGNGTHGCGGILSMGVNSVPQQGNANFTISTAHAPSTSLGACIVTDSQDLAGTDYLGLNLKLHVNLILATELFSLDSYSDSSGAAFAPAPIPASPLLIGANYYAQNLFVEPALFKCSTGAFGLVSSNGLKLTIQP